MKINYKGTTIESKTGWLIEVKYNNQSIIDKGEFYLNYLVENNKDFSNSTIKQLVFRPSIKLSSYRMRETMKDIEREFLFFQNKGGGNIKEFLNQLRSSERDEIINNILE